jgi:putative transposase
MAIKNDTLDGLLAGHDPQAVFANDGLFDELKKALAERVLNAEIDDHLDGEARRGSATAATVIRRRGLLTETSKLDLRIPRDREGTFDSKLIARYQRRFRHDRSRDPGASARALWPGGLPRSFISTVIDAVLETVAESQNRPLEPFDALRVKIRDEGSFATRPSMSRLASRRKEPSWAFGSRPRKALNSGCAS